MWMMGCNDGADFDSIQDPYNSRRLRPLMPRPATSGAAGHPACLGRIHGTDLLSLNHQYLAMAEQNKRDLNTQQVVVSSRWNPTPEQLQTLEELYRRGTRTPSAEQIQHITAQLRRFGKIEGKNVFYWFQNHKARERQKRRRQQESPSEEQTHANTNNNHTQNGEKKESCSDIVSAGASRTIVYEVEQTKNWASPTNSSTIAAAEKNVSTQGGAEKAEEAASELIKADGGGGWVQFDDEAELPLQGRNATWQMMNLSCSSSSSSTNLIINCSSAPLRTIPSTVNLIKHHDFNNMDTFLHPYNALRGLNKLPTRDDGREAQILQLFPLQSGNRVNEEFTYDLKEDHEQSGSEDMRVPSVQFFEFLPLKN